MPSTTKSLSSIVRFNGDDTATVTALSPHINPGSNLSIRCSTSKSPWKDTFVPLNPLSRDPSSLLLPDPGVSNATEDTLAASEQVGKVGVEMITLDHSAHDFGMENGKPFIKKFTSKWPLDPSSKADQKVNLVWKVADGMFSVDVKTRLLTDDQGHLSIIGTSASEPRPTRSGVPVDAVGAGSFSPTLSHLCARGENDHQTVKSNMDAEELYKVETVAKELSKKRNSPFAFVGTGLVTVNREAQAPVPFPPTNADSISDTVIVSDTDLGVVPWHFKLSDRSQ